MEVNQPLADISTVLVYSAMAVYTIAFVCYTIDLARRGDARQRRRAAAIGGNLTWLATALLLAAIVVRGVATARVPWANMYEFTLAGTFFAAAVFLGLSVARDVRYLGAFVTGPVLLLLGLAVSVFYADPAALPPALQSYWLIIHVAVATLSVGVFTVAAAATALQLAREHRERILAGTVTHDRPSRSGPRGWPARAWAVVAGPFRRGERVLDGLPSSESLERLAFRLNAIGFVLWTFTLIAGAIWAEHAWGRYWGWDAKEVWTFVIWIVYAGYLHARTTRGWAGRKAAIFALIGYVCILLNFFVVNLFFVSKHAYSGVG